MRGQIIGWSIGLMLWGLLIISFYDSIYEMGNQFETLLENYPVELMAFFGDLTLMTTPAGYLNVEYFSLITMVLGIFSIGAAVNLLVGDEERGVLDLVLAHPKSRSAIFWGRFLGLAAATILVLTVAWLSMAIRSANTKIGLNWLELLLPFLSLFAVLMLLSGVALLLSLLLPASKMAGMLSGVLIVGNFLLQGLAQFNDNLKKVLDFLPLKYYQGGFAAVEGLNYEWLLGLLAAALLLTVLAWLLFLRRDIRVGGEHSWSMPKLLSKKH